MADQVRKRSVRGRKAGQGLVGISQEQLLHAAELYIGQLPKYAKEIARRFILEFHPDGETMDEMAFLQWFMRGKPLSDQQIYEKSRKNARKA